MTRTTAFTALLAADLRSIDGGYSARGDRAIDAAYLADAVKRAWDDVLWWETHLHFVRRFCRDEAHAQAGYDRACREYGEALAEEEKMR